MRTHDPLLSVGRAAKQAGVSISTVGEWIDAGGPVAEVVDTRALEAGLDVPESFFAGLRLGEEVDVRVDALGGRSFPGRVRAIVPRADPRARTFPVKVELLGGVEEIGVGMLVKVLLPIGEPTPATLVPKDAVVAQGREGVLFVIEEDDTVRQISVRTGRAAGDWIEVTGVSVGARVVTQGNERLAPGQLVIPERSEHQAP